MRSFAGAFRLLAYATRSVNDQRFDGLETEMESKLLTGGIQRLTVPAPLRGPVSIPYAPLLETCASHARSGPIQPLVGVEVFAIDIGERQVRQVRVVDAPRGTVLDRLAAALALPEEHQLESEALSIGGAQVPGVIPPLGAKVRMLEVIAWKCVMVTRKRGAILEIHAPGDGCNRHGQQSNRAHTPKVAMWTAYDGAGELCGIMELFLCL